MQIRYVPDFLFGGLRQSAGQVPEGLLFKKRLIFTLTTTLALFLTSVSASPATVLADRVELAPIVEATASVALVTPAVEIAPENTNYGVEDYVRHYFAETPILAEIARCESKFRQYNRSGAALRGEIVSEDIGVMQVNEYYHRSVADKLGLDIYTLDGNLAYAKWLYDQKGTQPWSASAACWSR